MKLLTIFWFCAYDLKKGKKDINKLLDLKNQIVDEINLVLVDRMRIRKKNYVKPVLIKEKKYYLIKSCYKRSHHSDLFYVAEKFQSKYVLALTDDDLINYEELIKYIKFLRSCNSFILIAVPNNSKYINNNFGSLEPNKKYSFWQYQKNRNANIAYYSAIRTDKLIKNLGFYLQEEKDNWCHPLFDQVFIWSISRNHKSAIQTFNCNYLNYDNKNWEDNKSSLKMIKKLSHNYYHHEIYAMEDIIKYNYSKNFNFIEFIPWFFYLLARNFKYYRDFKRSFLLSLALIKFYLSNIFTLK